MIAWFRVSLGCMCFILSSAWCIQPIIAFAGQTEATRSRLDVRLDMGKGFNSARSKQAELAKKLALAKKQGGSVKEEEGEVAKDQLSDEERQLQEDRKRFAQLLVESKVQEVNKERRSASVRIAPKNIPTSKHDSPKAKSYQKRKNVSAKKEKNDDAEVVDTGPLQEGDIARRRDFERLISCETSQPLGAIQAAQLVPWVPPFLADYLVVLADPRTQSGDLRQTVKYLTSNLSQEVLQQVICINADSVPETKSWMNRAEVETPIRMFSDQEWEWMRTYSAVVNDGRWSMSVIVICNSGEIRTILREVDSSKASQLVSDAIKSLTP